MYVIQILYIDFIVTLENRVLGFMNHVTMHSYMSLGRTLNRTTCFYTPHQTENLLPNTKYPFLIGHV